MKCRRKVPIDTQTRANTHAAVDSRVLLSQTKAARATQTKATLTGESKEKAHSLLKTLSPVLGTLMVGMNGTSSSPRSAAIFAFLLLAPQCRGATGAALSEQRMLFLKHPVSTFLRPGGCDAENHKNKMTEGWRLAALFFCFFFYKMLWPAQKLHRLCWLRWRRSTHGNILPEGPLPRWFIKPPTLTTSMIPLLGWGKPLLWSALLIANDCSCSIYISKGYIMVFFYRQ